MLSTHGRPSLNIQKMWSNFLKHSTSKVAKVTGHYPFIFGCHTATSQQQMALNFELVVID